MNAVAFVVVMQDRSQRLSDDDVSFFGGESRRPKSNDEWVRALEGFCDSCSFEPQIVVFIALHICPQDFEPRPLPVHYLVANFPELVVRDTRIPDPCAPFLHLVYPKLPRGYDAIEADEKARHVVSGVYERMFTGEDMLPFGKDLAKYPCCKRGEHLRVIRIGKFLIFMLQAAQFHMLISALHGTIPLELYDRSPLLVSTHNRPPDPPSVMHARILLYRYEHKE